MSLVDDQALSGLLNGHPYNALDVLASDIDKCRDKKEAMKIISEFENKIKDKDRETKEGKTVIDPEKKPSEKIDQQQLLRGIQEDMEK